MSKTWSAKIHYIPESDTVIWIASTKGFYQGKSEAFKGFEFVDQLVAHLPFSPVSYRQSHPSLSKISQDTPPMEDVSADSPDAWAKLRRKSWARLLQKVYEVDPLVCPKCQGTMSAVAELYV